LPPIALGPDAEVTIGRRDCSLVLPHTEVSRHHATIRSSAGKILVEDHGSSNGTYVNGKRITSQDVRVGDVIKVGPYSIEVWAVPELPAPDPGVTSAVPFGVEAAFSGRIGPVSLAEVLEGIEARQRTGTLSIVSRHHRGRIKFAAGKVIDAEWGFSRGEVAVKECLALVFGDYAFSTDAGA
jgi:hypothetical protein